MVKAYRDCFTTSVHEKRQWFKEATGDGELRFQSLMALKDVLQNSMQAEIELQLGGLSRYERSEQRRDQRNGYYTRELVTEEGVIRDLKVPRSRHGVYEPQVFRRYQRRRAVIDEMIVDIFIGGDATRRVGPALEALVGECISASTVSQVTKVLQAHADAYHHRPLEDRYQYLLLDGICLRAKSANGRRKVLVLAAYGITVTGHRELIDFCQADSEGEAAWTRFLQSLYLRGLRGHQLRLVTTDGAAGLIAALDMVFPLVPRQRCWVHKLRNVTNKLRQRNRPECLKQAQQIYLAPNRRQAIARFKAWKSTWEPLEPGAVTCLATDMDTLLVFLDCPQAHQITIRTTNPIERCFREVRRRTNPMTCFNNPQSIDRIVFATFAHHNAQWSSRPIRHFTQDT